MNKKTWDLVVGVRPPIKRLCSSSAFPGFTSKMILVSMKGGQEESQVAAAWRTPLGCRRGCEGGLSSREQPAGSPHRSQAPEKHLSLWGLGLRSRAVSRGSQTHFSSFPKGGKRGFLDFQDFIFSQNLCIFHHFIFFPELRG